MSLADRLLRYAGLLVDRPADPLTARDPAFIEEELPLLARAVDALYAPEVMGMEHVPRSGRLLAVGTHNGGTLAPDMFALMVAFWHEFGADRPAYGLAHDLTFRIPGVGAWLARMGGVPARPEHARALLEREAAVLVYPGGDVDAFKPYAERHVVKFGGRTGFVRVAIQTGAPILPVVSVGAHEAFYVLTDGHEVAEALRLKQRLRLEVLPIIFTLPWGIVIGPVFPYLPVPTKVRLRALPPIDLALPPSAADDREAVAAAAERIRAAMQAALDELVAEGNFGVKARAIELFGELPPQR
jgi:1-acyl-sn-glycerol-3-phosphate acyltransferase